MESCRVVDLNPFILQEAVKNVRPFDELEFTTLGETVMEAVVRCIEMSNETHALVAEPSSRAVWVWGFGANLTRPGWDVPWGLGTNLLDTHKRSFMRQMISSCNGRLAKDTCAGLSNYVHAGNHDQIETLRDMGFKVEMRMTFMVGPECRPFHRFERSA